MTTKIGNSTVVSVSMPTQMYEEIKEAGVKFSAIFRRGVGVWKGEVENPRAQMEELKQANESMQKTLQRMIAERDAAVANFGALQEKIAQAGMEI